jgi:dihydroxyacetone kinase-like protein
MHTDDIKGAMASVSTLMTASREYLVSLDQQNGDGDLGISMSDGYAAVLRFLETSTETDFGKTLMKMGMVFNEASPSSLGTITSIGMMAMGKALKGKEHVSVIEFADALDAGLLAIMLKAGSKPGEKTILDALVPTCAALRKYPDDEKQAFAMAAEAAAQGSESTIAMKAVHGRAAYYAEKSIGVLDGGSVVGKLLFEGINAYCQEK